MRINKSIINQIRASRAEPSRALHFKLFSSLCLLTNYKILFYLFIKNLFKFFFEFKNFQTEKNGYLFKLNILKFTFKEIKNEDTIYFFIKFVY